MIDEIDLILNAGKKRKRGGSFTRFKRPIWQCDRHDPENNITLAVISMCIKDDMKQTLSDLAIKVAETKDRPIGECLAVLQELRDKGELGYYDDVTKDWTEWTPGEEI